MMIYLSGSRIIKGGFMVIQSGPDDEMYIINMFFV